MNGKQKHVPTRTCVVCREKYDKRKLFRLVMADGQLIIDQTGKQNGRGAYLCHSMACWKLAADTDVLSKALRTQLSVQDRRRLSQIMQTQIDR